jgi:hypothetical protein
MAKKNKNQYVSPAMQAPPALEPVAVVIPKIEFDAWFAIREHRIPKQHRKEIIKADFKARGLRDAEQVADYDAALEKYGVKLA